MADATELQASQSVKLAGSGPITGIETYWADVDVNGNLKIISYAGGSASGGSAASISDLVGGVYNSTAPTLTNGQQASLQLDVNGNLKVNLAASSAGVSTETTLSALNSKFVADFGVSISSVRVAALLGNVNGSAAFGTGTTTAQTLRVVLPTDQTAIPVTQSGIWNINNISGTISLPTGAATSALQTTGNASLGSIDSKITSTNNQVQVRDIISNAGQYRAQSVTTSAALALGGGSALANRKFISITPTNGTIYWGFDASVTTTTGSPIFKNQTMTFAFNIPIYVIAAATTDARISEGS